MKRNYQKELEKIVSAQKLEQVSVEERPTLLLHSCCAPCSSYCMEYLRRYFQITVLYYNPNITNKEEYQYRLNEQRRLIDAYNQIEKVSAEENKQAVDGRPLMREVTLSKISLLEGRYDPKEFLEMAKGYEEVPEGGERCFRCYKLRLTEAAVIAKKEGFDYFTTTLTISPLKNAEKLNTIGEALASEMGISFLPSDFKKNNGYKRSTELSKEYDLYRQDYCGCAYSKAEREKQKREHMRLRPFDVMRDGKEVLSWLSNERECAMWSANHISYNASSRELESLLEKNQNEWNDQALIMENDLGEPCGFICCNCNTNQEMFIKYVIVSNKHRGKGLGSNLLQLIIEYGKKQFQAKSVRLAVFEVNAPARALYAKMGFRAFDEVEEGLEFQGETWKKYLLRKDLE